MVQKYDKVSLLRKNIFAKNPQYLRFCQTICHNMAKIRPNLTLFKKIIIDNSTAKYYNYVEHKKH